MSETNTEALLRKLRSYIPDASFASDALDEYVAALHAERAAMRALHDDMVEAANGLVNDAADWRDSADKTGGHAATRLVKDALINETRAAQIRAWTDRLDAALSASVPPPRDTPDAQRCEGRYPVPHKRDEPFDVTYRCALPHGHDGPHGTSQ